MTDLKKFLIENNFKSECCSNELKLDNAKVIFMKRGEKELIVFHVYFNEYEDYFKVVLNTNKTEEHIKSLKKHIKKFIEIRNRYFKFKEKISKLKNDDVIFSIEDINWKNNRFEIKCLTKVPKTKNIYFYDVEFILTEFGKIKSNKFKLSLTNLDITDDDILVIKSSLNNLKNYFKTIKNYFKSKNNNFMEVLK